MPETSIGALEPGEAVLLRCESRFNGDVTHTVAGVVADTEETDNDWAEVVIEDECDFYVVEWSGVVERQKEVGVWDPYGSNGRLWTLDPVDHVPDDVPDEELTEGDERTADPLLDQDGDE